MSNILVVGDSFSHVNGFDRPEGKLWFDIFSDRHNITNLSLYGQSNYKIFSKTTKALYQNEFDLIIIQWTSLFRLTFNSGHSIDDNEEICTFTSVWNPQLKKIHSVWSRYFIHPRVEIVEFLLHILALSDLLQAKNIPYIFIKTFENYFSELQKDTWTLCSDDFLDTVLFRHQSQDWEIEKFYTELKDLYDKVESLTGKHWLNLKSDPWFDQIFDYADDGGHPGINTCKKYGNDVVDFAKTLRILL